MVPFWNNLARFLETARLTAHGLFARRRTLLGLGILTLILVGGGVSLALHPAFAQDTITGGIFKYIGLVIAWAMHYVVAFEGWLLIKMVGILIWVAQYNGFIDAGPVATGWFIVRDVVNMFFILVLLIIAFGTILGIDSYSYQKTLPKLLIAAVIVNFTRTICGLLIDFSQVIMLTFVNGFSQAATGNFANAFGITEMLDYSVSEGGGDQASFAQLVAAWLLAGILVGFALLVVIYITVILITRIVIIWVLVILSPLAFFLNAVPAGGVSKYYGQWWSKFSSQLFAGPAIAFFLWLALLSVSKDIVQDGGFPAGNVGTGEAAAVEVDAGMFKGDALQKYIIAICLLLVGLEAGKSSGTAFGQMTSAPGKMWKTAKGAYKTGMAAGGKVVEKTPGLSRLRDSGKDTMLSLGTRLGSSSAAKALSEHRGKVAGKGADFAKTMANLRPDEMRRFAFGTVPDALLTSEGLGRRREAQKAYMEKIVKRDKSLRRGGESDDQYRERMQQEFSSLRRSYGSIAKRTNDKTADNTIKGFHSSRPDLIIDPSETNPEERKKQREDFKKFSSNLGVKQLSELEPSQITGGALMFANPRALAGAFKQMGQAQEDKVYKELGISPEEAASFEKMKDEDKVKFLRGKLQQARWGNLDMLSDDDAKVALKEMREAVAAGTSSPGFGAASSGLATSIRNGKGDSEMMSTFAGAATPEMIKDLAGKLAKVNAEELGRSPALADRLAAVMDAAQIAAAPAAVAQVLRDRLAAGNTDGANAAKILAAGGSVEQALSHLGFDAERGDISGHNMRQAADFFAANPALAAGISADVLRGNGGRNAISISMVSSLKMGDLNKLAESGDTRQAVAMMESAAAVEGMDMDVAMREFGEEMAKAGLGADEQARLTAEVRDVLAAAKESAKKIVEASRDQIGSPLMAAMRGSSDDTVRGMWSAFAAKDAEQTPKAKHRRARDVWRAEKERQKRG